jgi:uncharacterized protein YdiU (UPF0061 family)
MFVFDNTYARLEGSFFARVQPTKVREPRVFYVNRQLCELLGVDPERIDADVFSGNVVPPGADPIALAYAGHQFGAFVPQLGDGRAILLGEVVGKDGARRDVQLKGAGRTPFSRGGDGRAALGPVMREVVVSEAMAALGIPTTRALVAVTTGQPVLREEALPGAVLTRVAASHLRVGTFEYFAARRDIDALAALTAYALARHCPGAGGEPVALLDHVVGAQASLVARWLGVGFVHGVMNTDNTTISGETIDFGPCAFLDEYNPEKRFSSIDHAGRYAFQRQPRIARWNVARLGEALLPLLANDEADGIRLATECIERFVPRFEAAYDRVLRDKLGLAREEPEDRSLAESLLSLLAVDGVDYTIFFRKLCDVAGEASAEAALLALFRNPLAFHDWLGAWRRRLALEEAPPGSRAAAMRTVNPAFIPRNHRIEQAIDAATHHDDFAPFHALTHVLSRPFANAPAGAHLADPPAPEERVTRTFCGT